MRFHAQWHTSGKRWLFTATLLVAMICVQATSAVQSSTVSTLVRDINTQTTADQFPAGAFSTNDLVALKGKLFFSVLPKTQSGLWTSDGTTLGTTSVITFPMVGTEFGPSNWIQRDTLTATSSRLFFSGSASDGYRLWTSDGTSTGTVELANIKRALALRSLNNKLVALTQASSTELGVWTSDGTPAGTTNTENITLSSPVVDVLAATEPLTSELYFVLRRLNTTTNLIDTTVTLWRTNGASGSTTQVASIPNVTAASAPVVLDGRLFVLVVQNNQYALWTSDGTTAGTSLVTTIPFAGSTSLTVLDSTLSLSVNNDLLYFAADDGIHGQELWQSNGSAANTSLIADIYPGTASSSPSALVSIYGTLLFAATDAVNGRELWASDGTAPGTNLIDDIVPGIASSNPSAFTAASGFVGFIADDGTTGRELHVITAPSTSTLQLSVPPSIGAAPQKSAVLPIQIMNRGTTVALSTTLQITLGNGLTFLSDTSGISPTINGNVVAWTLPDTTFLVQRSFEVRVGTPDQPFGTRIPLELRVTAQGSNGGLVDTSAKSELLIARQIFLPTIQR